MTMLAAIGCSGASSKVAYKARGIAQSFSVSGVLFTPRSIGLFAKCLGNESTWFTAISSPSRSRSPWQSGCGTIEPRKFLFWVPTPCKWWKATHLGASARAHLSPGVVRDPGMCRRSLARNRTMTIDRSEPPPRAARLASRRHTQGGSRVQESCRTDLGGGGQ